VLVAAALAADVQPVTAGVVLLLTTSSGSSLGVGPSLELTLTSWALGFFISGGTLPLMRGGISRCSEPLDISPQKDVLSGWRAH
jgi:hypothetical protein